MYTYTVKVEQLQRRVYEIKANAEYEVLHRLKLDDSYIYEDDETPDISIELKSQ